MKLVELGYFSKTSGIKGELILKSDKDFDHEHISALFVEAAGDKAPYFVREIRFNGKDFVVSLEETDTIEKASALKGKKVFAEEKFIEAEEEVLKLQGFELIDKKLGSLGEIVEVSDSGHQLLVTIIYKNKEIILPLAEELIEQIDEGNRKIIFSAPEGLIDLYLES